MPVFHPEILNSIIYLYKTSQDAEESRFGGGSGFLLSINSKLHSRRKHLYAITASHVVREEQSPVIRLNRRGGGVTILPLTSGDWIQHPDGDELEVCPLPPDMISSGEYCGFPGDTFMTREWLEEMGAGPGLEVAMVGRFVLHEGRGKNMPAVRWGHVAMMPDEPVVHPYRGILQEVFLIEMHSISGYSGSPVLFVARHRPDVHWFNEEDALPEPKSFAMSTFLLGVDCLHLDKYAKVLRSDGTEHPEELKVKRNTGMMAAVPAWKLDDLINSEELVMARKKQDEDWARGEQEHGSL